MAKRIVESPQAMKALVGQELGVSDWLVMTQERINTFAEASGDHQWIHVDVERCKTDMPDGKTIAHGNLTFSVISTFARDVLKIENMRNGINYGSNKVRYTSPVQVGARIRGRQKLLAADDMPNGGIRMTYQWTVEIEGQERPACVAETMSIAYART
ncbi:MAG: MaoC family dehydratase [Reyranella sp.]|nr:MaoC family dehydratase [Reyranella sp.]